MNQRPTINSEQNMCIISFEVRK